MNTNKNAVTVQMPDGKTALQTLESFVNYRSAAAEASRTVPMHRATLVPVSTTRDDYADIKGNVYLKHSARCRLAAAAGVQEACPPIWETFQRDGKTCVRVSVALIRPPVITEPMWGQADGCEADQKPAEKEHYTAKLQTRAHARALKKILGESFMYSKAELGEKDGLFLVASYQPDANDPDVRATLLRNMDRSTNRLYSAQPPKTQTPPSTPEVGDVAEWEDEPDEVYDFGAPEATLPPPVILKSAIEIPAWARGFAVNEFGLPRFDTLQIAECQAIVERELKATKYDGKTDPAGIVELGRQARTGDTTVWPEIAQKLFVWQTGGGSHA